MRRMALMGRSNSSPAPRLPIAGQPNRKTETVKRSHLSRAQIIMIKAAPESSRPPPPPPYDLNKNARTPGTPGTHSLTWPGDAVSMPITVFIRLTACSRQALQ